MKARVGKKGIYRFQRAAATNGRRNEKREDALASSYVSRVIPQV